MNGSPRRYPAKRGISRLAAGLAALFLVIAPLPAVAEGKGELRETVIAVQGMLCSSCAAAVEKALQRLDGVTEARADAKGDRVLVRYDGEKVTPRQMTEAIRKAGYRPQGEEPLR